MSAGESASLLAPHYMEISLTKGDNMDKEKLEYFTNLVLKERQRIMRDLNILENDIEVTSESKPTAPATEFEERAFSNEDKELLTNLLDLKSEELTEVNEAIRRVIDGTYGKCTMCGEQIPEERLEALPTTPLCLKCKQEMEKRMIFKKKEIGGYLSI